MSTSTRSMFWLRATREYMRLLGDGILVHGPLLGWSLFHGDKFKKRIEVSPTGCVEYAMPVRAGFDHSTYPWHQHGHDAVEGTRKLMRDLGVWSSRNEGVELRASVPTAEAHKNANLAKRAQALKTAGMAIQPHGFGFALMDDERMSSVSLSILSQQDGNLPHGIDQFFGPSTMDVWSIFMQEKGEFLWAFKRTGATSMVVYKVMGRSTERPEPDQGTMSDVPCPPVYDFLVYDIKPVPQHMGLLSTYQQEPRNAE